MLRFVSYLAPNWFWFYEAVASYLGQILATKVEIHQGRFDPLIDPLLLQNQIDVAFICGLPFSKYFRLAPHQFQLLAAPVMQDDRYHDRPIYFADVIVNATSGINHFHQLKGKTFCYNDPGSNSGYYLLCQHLHQSGCTRDFFSNTLQSGAHQRSIEWVANGLVDCAAIDSTVLDQALREDPILSAKLRIVISLGPSPMPPIAVSQQLGQALIQQLRQALLSPDVTLQRHMTQADIQHFAAVDHATYEPILTMYQLARKLRSTSRVNYDEGVYW